MAERADLPAVQDESLRTILSDRYLAYALSTITARSLPDARDGLKPVHRRVLYAMYEMGLTPDAQPRKAAKVVGDTMARFHPHGDLAIYEALVRLAQPFQMRYPLIDGQGNFGSIDGDGAAAMRYTECRLTELGAALFEGIDEDAVPFRDTYAADGREPLVLPAAFPHLLANGAQGIAVGMATAIPPHNLGELCAALLALLDEPELDEDRLLALVPGPDFPTGGVLVEPRAAIADAYRTGRGGFRLRARWQREELKLGQWQAVVTEIPWSVAKSRLVEDLAKLVLDRKAPLLEDVRDESAADVRLVLVPKSRSVDPAVLMESLFRLSDLEIRVPLNLNVLDRGVEPRVLPLRPALSAWIAHRAEVLLRRTRHRVGKIDRRLEVLGGLLVAYLNLDEVIRIIREADEPKPALIARFALTDVQAEAILNTRLRSLRRLEEMELRGEQAALEAERADLLSLLADPARQRAALKDEVTALDRRFGRTAPGGARRTGFADLPDGVATAAVAEALVEREPVTVLLSEKGWIRALKGHGAVGDLKHKEGDAGRFQVPAWTTDRLLLAASTGRFYGLATADLPGARGFGEPVRLMIDLAPEAEIVALLRAEPGLRLLLATEDGRGFVVRLEDAMASTRAGRQVFSPSEGLVLRWVLPLSDGLDHVACLGTNRRLLIFPVTELPEAKSGRGAVLQRVKDAKLSDLRLLRLADGLTWPRGEGTKTETDLREWLGHRGAVGRQPPRGFPRTGKL